MTTQTVQENKGSQNNYFDTLNEKANNITIIRKVKQETIQYNKNLK